jgi:hypothetical protein
MQIKTIGQGPHPDFSISGSIVTVAGIEIDAEARQSEAQSVIDIRQSAGIAHEGGNGYQLATIVIPPRDYELIEAEGEPTEGEEGESTERHALPLDTRRVAVTIWPAV